MSAMQANSVVVDVSVLPIRPEICKIKAFLDDKLQLDATLVKSIQLHNVRNQVIVEFGTREAADRFVAAHHMAHCMSQQQLQYKIPVYINDNAVDVRVHDLSSQVSNDAVIDHLNRFGEVMTIRNEVWKNFFPGIPNGVRVVRMKLAHPIPSYTTINNETTLVTYRGQTRTCRNCGQRAHPNRRCSEVKQQNKSTLQTRTNASNSISYAAAVQSAPEQQQQWAPSPPSAETFRGFSDDPTVAEESSTKDNANVSSPDDSTDTAHMKRQRSIETESAETNNRETKKNCSEQPEQQQQTTENDTQSNSLTHDPYETESYRRACEEWKIHRAEVEASMKWARKKRDEYKKNEKSVP